MTSIFINILISIIFGLLTVALIYVIYLIADVYVEIRHVVAAVMMGIGVTIMCVFIGIDLETASARSFVAGYEAQKYTIESSLESDILSGLERIELVKQASELNGELAERQAKSKIWHYVLYDNDIYDSVEFIDLTGGNEE